MIAFIITVIVVAILYYVFPFIQVCGDSMYPTYLDGEVIIGTRIFNKSKLKKGDIIVYKSPTDDKIVIKRIERLMTDKKGELFIYCLGDNADFSYDSRMYGYFSSKNLVCKVLNQRRYLYNEPTDN